MVAVVAFESSCDETAVAYFDSNTNKVHETMYSQVTHHAPYGGVVPELASRQHLEKISILCNKLREECGFEWNQLDAIAFTQGPGLKGSLLVGASFATAAR